MRGNRNHSEATREKISEAIKKKWLDIDYRSIERKPPNEEVRARISAALKSKWEQPQYRERMRNSSYTRTDAWRAVVSQKVKDKWKDPVYKEAVTSALRKHFDMLRSSENSTSSSDSKRRRKVSPSQSLLRRREIAAMQKAKKFAIKTAKEAVRNRTENLDLKSLLGKDIWFEEKVRTYVNQAHLLMEYKYDYKFLTYWYNPYIHTYIHIAMIRWSVSKTAASSWTTMN